LKDVEVLKAEFETYLMTKKVETKEEDDNTDFKNN
jgi:hypothetical protein